MEGTNDLPKPICLLVGSIIPNPPVLESRKWFEISLTSPCTMIYLWKSRRTKNPGNQPHYARMDKEPKHTNNNPMDHHLSDPGCATFKSVISLSPAEIEHHCGSCAEFLDGSFARPFQKSRTTQNENHDAIGASLLVRTDSRCSPLLRRRRLEFAVLVGRPIRRNRRRLRIGQRSSRG